jgi:hypothetical protein
MALIFMGHTHLDHLLSFRGLVSPPPPVSTKVLPIPAKNLPTVFLFGNKGSPFDISPPDPGIKKGTGGLTPSAPFFLYPYQSGS